MVAENVELLLSPPRPKVSPKDMAAIQARLKKLRRDRAGVTREEPTPTVKFDPDQPREPAGSAEGGQFASGGGGGGGETTAGTGTRAASAEEWVNGLSEPQAQAIENWTDGDIVDSVRMVDSGQRIDQDAKDQRDRIYEAIATAPLATGPVWRGMLLTKDEYRGAFGVGSEITMDSLTSFSEDESAARNFYDKPSLSGRYGILMQVVNNRSGARIAAVGIEKEKEVLVVKGTRYRVLARSLPRYDETLEYDRLIVKVKLEEI